LTDEITKTDIVGGCAGCGREAECEIWEHPSCYVCASAIAKVFPTYGQIEAKYGSTASAQDILRDFTKRWFTARKTRAA
jgi:hypothetical protein